MVCIRSWWFSIASELKHTLLSQKIEKGLRALDMMSIVETQNRGKVILVLLPFSDKSVVEGYMQRLATLIEEEGETMCTHLLFTMRHLTQVKEYIFGKGA
jgi:hypothetical protein